MVQFGPEVDECLEYLLREQTPRSRLQLPVSLLDSTAPLNTKVFALGVDEVARRSVSRTPSTVIGQRLGMPARTAERAAGDFERRGYGRRRRRGQRGVEVQLLHRRPGAWIPRYSLEWMRSGLCPGLSRVDVYALLMLLAESIRRTPSTMDHARQQGPWCDMPLRSLARVVRRGERTELPRLLRTFADVGLGVVLARPAPHPPLILPAMGPLTRRERTERVACMVSLLVDAYPSDSALREVGEIWDDLEASGDWGALVPELTARGLRGLSAPTVWDDELLAAQIAPTVSPDRLPAVAAEEVPV